MNVKANTLIPLLIIIVGLMLIIGAILSYLYIQNINPESSLVEKIVCKVLYFNAGKISSKGIKVGPLANINTSVLIKGEPWYSQTLI
jgi:uncharacterized membrane protein (UPF0136 family)